MGGRKFFSLAKKAGEESRYEKVTSRETKANDTWKDIRKKAAKGECHKSNVSTYLRILYPLWLYVCKCQTIVMAMLGLIIRGTRFDSLEN